MPPGLIVLVIVVGISLLITVASNWLRSQQRKVEANAADKRARARTAGGERPAVQAGAGDIDRFLEEINKLRQKQPAAEPAGRKPRKAEPVRQAKPAPAARRAEPVAPPVAVPVSRLADLPVAPVVARPVPAAGASRPPVMKPAQEAAPPTAFARQFAGLLTDPKSLPMMVLLQEVLGPPKCLRRSAGGEGR